MSAADEWRVEEEVGKHQLMRRTGLPARDLRALGPPLSHPSASILGRDRAVVVCLDRVRAVVTTSEVLVPGPRDPAVAQLVRDLLARLGGGSAHTPTASPAPPQVVTVRLPACLSFSSPTTTVALISGTVCLRKSVLGGRMGARRTGSCWEAARFCRLN